MKTIEEQEAVVVVENGHEQSVITKPETPGINLPPGSIPLDPLVVHQGDQRRSPAQFFREMGRREQILAGIGAVLILAGLVAVFTMHTSKPAAPAPMAVPVLVQTVAPKQVRLWSEFSGRMEAVNFAEIRPEVSGKITEIRFTEGQTVQKGDVLLVIDPEPYKAALDKAQANSELAKTEFDRAGNMVKAQAIAQRVYDERSNASRVADADLESARVNYSRAYVKAPISGRVSRAEITVGNLVQAGSNAPLLTSIVSNHGIYADFEVDEQTYLESLRNKSDDQNDEHAIPVELTVQGDKDHVYKGSIYSFDNHIDNVSGTIRARAKFDNADGQLVPGMFVSVRVGSSKEVTALTVPERAVGVDQNKKYAYVVNKDNKVEYREVTLGKNVDSDRVVLTGIQAGDRVIVDGTQHVRPDALVSPKEAPAPVAAAPVTTPPPAADDDN